MNHTRFNINGLEQPETQERVKNQLENIIGVKEVCISEGQNYVDINYDEQISEVEINNHLQNNGYKIKD